MERRYCRQSIFPKIGEEGQKRLKESSVLIVGCGALGTVSANNLVRAGIGRVKVIDRDFVEIENLQRQMLYDESDVERKIPKSVAAVEKLRAVNSSICIEGELCDLNPRNAEEKIVGFDIVLDANDNMETRFVINDACLKHNIPWIYCSAVSSFGMVMNIIPGKSACLRCLVGELPGPGTLQSCDTAGILNSVTSIMASLQSNEAIKILIDSEDICRDLIYVDVWSLSFNHTSINRREDCPACVMGNFEYLNPDSVSHAVSLCGRNAVQINPVRDLNLSMDELRRRLSRSGDVSYNGFFLSFKIPGYELIIYPDGRTMIKGTTDESIAKSLYSRWIGA